MAEVLIEWMDIRVDRIWDFSAIYDAGGVCGLDWADYFW